MKPAAFLTVALCVLALAACAPTPGGPAPRPASTRVLVLPSGERYTVLGTGVLLLAHAAPTLTLEYQSNVDFGDRAALHQEALGIWRLFQLSADENYTAAVLRAVPPPNGSTVTTSQGANFNFVKKNDVWGESNTAPKVLSGPMQRFAWRLGTWQCTATFARDGFKRRYRGTQIFQIDPTGRVIQESDAVYLPRGPFFSIGDHGWDDLRHVWYDRVRQAGRTETGESSQPYSHSMVFTVTTREASGRTSSERQHLSINDAENIDQIESEIWVRDTWRPTNRTICNKPD